MVEPITIIALILSIVNPIITSIITITHIQSDCNGKKYEFEIDRSKSTDE